MPPVTVTDSVSSTVSNARGLAEASESVCRVTPPRLPAAPVNPAVAPQARQLFEQFGHAPGLIESWLQWYQPLVINGRVATRTKELCRLAVARRTGCHMCQNSRFADPSGTGPAVPAAEADAVLADDWSRCSPQERAALTYTVAYWDSHDAVSDQVINDVCAAYGRDGFLEIAVCVAQFSGMGRLFHMLGISAGPAE
jgi:alkylhydroperoxidase family enzyme